MTKPCILGRSEHPSPRANLYLFPHSGGMPGTYIQWKRELRNVNLFGVQYPGRGSRIGEPACRTVDDIAEDVLANAELRPPYVLMGHSLGAMVAYEVAARLVQTGSGPAGLIVSAVPSPALRMTEPGLSRRSTEELLGEIGKLSPRLSASLEGADELKEMFVKVLRSDLHAAETYEYRPREPLPLPIVFLGGRQDTIGEKQAESWSRFTSRGFQMHFFDGGHFYFDEHPRPFFERLSQVIDGLASGGIP